MNVEELISFLQALPEEQKKLPVYFVPPYDDMYEIDETCLKHSSSSPFHGEPERIEIG